MHTKNQITITDVLITGCCMFVLLACLGAVGNTSRGRAKREVCLNNLRRLTDAWEAYAFEHDGRLPNGSTGFSKDLQGCGGTRGAVNREWPPWIISDWFRAMYYLQSGDTDALGAMLKGPDETTQVRLKNGAVVVIRGTNQLYKYCRDLKVLTCPCGDSTEMVTYSIVDAMAGAATWSLCGTPSSSMGPAFLNISEISSPSEKFVFVDEGRLTSDSWTQRYDRPEWYDPVPAPHDMGGTFSFADGHAEYRKWTDPDTIELAKLGLPGSIAPPYLVYQPCSEDLRWVQIHAWGQLGYDPNDYTCP